MDPDVPSPASVLLAELKDHATVNLSVNLNPGSLALETNGEHLETLNPVRGRGPGPPFPQSNSDCAESAGDLNPHDTHQQDGAWQQMLDMEDDEDVVALLSRALHETPQEYTNNTGNEQHMFQHQLVNNHRPTHGHPYHGGVTRGVVSQLRRVQTTGGGGRLDEGMHDHESNYPIGFQGGRTNGVGNNMHYNQDDSPRNSLVDRLRLSVARADGIRRSRSSPDQHIRRVPCDEHMYDGSDVLIHDNNAHARDAVYGASSRAAHLERAAERLNSQRPFGFLGVTRPPWQTRWEAHIVAPDEHGADSVIFLGAFDAKESAARAHDAARLKLFGEVNCGELNFPKEEYLETLAAMHECSFEEFVRSLVRHGHNTERRLSRFRGVHAAPEGKWEARLENDAEDA